MIDRIAKLLNQAERAATPDEAQIYFDKAQTLATAYSISLAKARMHTSSKTQREKPTNKTIRIGDARRHVNRHLVMLMHPISATNDLKMDVAQNSTYVILYGFPGDIAASEALWAKISTQMVRFGEAYLAQGDWRKDQRLIIDGATSRLASITKQSARATYFEAFIATMASRLSAARKAAVKQSTDGDSHFHSRPDEPGIVDLRQSESSTALALKAKEVEVLDFYSHQSSARGSWGGVRSRVIGLSDSAKTAGSRDAQRVSLSDHVSLGGSRRAVGS